MTRLAEIHNCFTCPHYDEDLKDNDYCCYGDNNIKLDIDVCFEIDKDCPLPKKKRVNDNMSKNSLIKRIQEKYTSLNKEYHQLKTEIETSKPFQIEAWIDNESNYLNIKINNYDDEYTRVHQAFKNIEEIYGNFDKVEWGSMYIIGRYQL